jgi:phosphomannomutase
MPAEDPIKVYDARWEENEFSDSEVRRLLEAMLLYGRGLGADTLTLARDARLGGSRVMDLAIELAVEAGFRVYACAEPISTPASYFLSSQMGRRHPGTMGLTITASHNPAQYIGLKLVVPPLRAVGLGCGPEGGLSRVREIYHGRDSLGERRGGSLRVVNLTQQYIRSSMRLAGLARGDLGGLEVVLDAMHGSAGSELYQALELCGVRIRPLRVLPDGGFPTGSPNPTSRGKMEQAIALAARSGAAALIGTDGDGDRLVFGDRRGLLDAGLAAIPILASLGSPEASGPTVLHDPKVNSVALAQWRAMGIRPSLFRNGHSQVKERMRELDALAAVEESGHFYHRMRQTAQSVYCENSMLTVMLLLKALKGEPALFDRLWSLQGRLYCTGEMNFQADSESAREGLLEEFLHWLREDGAVLTSTTADGVDLGGTAVDRAGADPQRRYNGFLRAATNEKAVARVFLWAGSVDLGEQLKRRLGEIAARRGARTIE